MISDRTTIPFNTLESRKYGSLVRRTGSRKWSRSIGMAWGCSSSIALPTTMDTTASCLDSLELLIISNSLGTVRAARVRHRAQTISSCSTSRIPTSCPGFRNVWNEWAIELWIRTIRTGKARASHLKTRIDGASCSVMTMVLRAISNEP